MSTENSSRRFRRNSIWVSLLLVLVAAVTLEVTSITQFYYSGKAIKEEADKRAAGELESTRLEIMDVVHQTESAVRNSVWIAQWGVHHLDSLSRVAWRVVQDNPVVVGSTVALIPGYSKEHPLYAPYWYERGEEMFFASLATDTYDYPSQPWFSQPLEQGTGYWSEPYVDGGGGGFLMSTYSVPLADREGVPAAVLTADISLEWLSALLDKATIYPRSFDVIVSRDGMLMVSQDKTFAMQKTVTDLQAVTDDPDTYREICRQMLDGRSGVIPIRHHGERYYVYFAPVERTGWSMAVVIPEASIYLSLRKMSYIIGILQLLGLIMLSFILWAVIRTLRKNQDLNQRRERLEGELQTARNIQMSMIPKVFPPFPERTDIDLAASIVPAKEVGGDLYDFYIRDEKLFFCVGDVSGKGVPASLLMAVTRSQFRSVSAHEIRPGRIVSILNDSMVSTNEDVMFVTFFCGVLDMQTGHLRYCNAGHNAPLLFTTEVAPLPVIPNVPLGVIPGMDFQEQEIVLHYDDALFLYTDGITEAENAQHQLFGENRMEAVLHERRSSVDHLHALQKAIASFVGDAPQSDDITMLFIHYLNEKMIDDGNWRHLVLHNDIRQIPRLAQFVDAIARKKQLDTALSSSLNLALEETVTNVMLYAYPKGTDGTVDIEMVPRDNALVFIVSDCGTPFDPTAAPEADVNLGVEERPIGGLGIFLVRQIMDSVSYERKGDRNVLTMIKKL